MERKIVRKLRHWKQQYEKNAAFICCREMEWDGVDYAIGDPIPNGLFLNKTKLENFWEANWIELAEFEAVPKDDDDDGTDDSASGVNDSQTVPDDDDDDSDDSDTSGDAEDTAGGQGSDDEKTDTDGDDSTETGTVTVEPGNGSWWVVTLPDGSIKKFNGRKALDAYLATLE